MDRTTDEFTPLRRPWREALKRAGSLEALRPYLHLGQIPARHGGLYSWPDGRPRSAPGDVKPAWWHHAYEDRAGRVIFFLEPVWSGSAVIDEQVFAYAVSIELDSVAFDAVFPVAARPPLEPEPAPLVEPPPEPKQSPPERTATRRARRGPPPGTIDRFAPADRALFPEMTKLIKQQRITAGEAARILSDKIKGRGGNDSRIRRLAERYRTEVKN